MKQYKVLTNMFRDFDEGDIIIAPDVGWYYMDLRSKNDDIKRRHITEPVPKLPAEFVENYPEHFEEVKEKSNKDLRALTFSLAKDIGPILKAKMHELRLVAHSVTFEIDDAINADINSLTIKI